jgi:hypothetical protein
MQTTLEQAVPGTIFTSKVPANATADELRQQLFQQYGREVYLKAKLGPWEFGDTGPSCPIEPVDDEAIDIGLTLEIGKDSLNLLPISDSEKVVYFVCFK